MSAMLGSSRRDERLCVRLEGDEVVFVDRSRGPLRIWVARFFALLEEIFTSPEPRA